MKHRSKKNFIAALLGGVSLIISISLWFFSPPSFIHNTYPLAEQAGTLTLFLSSVAGFFIYFFGLGAFLIPFVCAGIAYGIMRERRIIFFITGMVLLIITVCIGNELYFFSCFDRTIGGGYIGINLSHLLSIFLEIPLLKVCLSGLLFLSILLLIPFSLMIKGMRGGYILIKKIPRYSFPQKKYQEWRKSFYHFWQSYIYHNPDVTFWLIEELLNEQTKNKKQTETHFEIYTAASSTPQQSSFKEDPAIASHVELRHYILPPVSLFEKSIQSTVPNDQENNALLLQEKLKRFGISGTVSNIVQGPVVTLFEYKPHITIKISRILALEDDLALALKATSLRIIAPVPGKSVIGFEVANTKRHTIYFSDIFVPSKASRLALPLFLGQNAQGHSMVADLIELPHLLVAGSTGSGKSVVLNTLIMSLLSTQLPSKVKLILLDPKRLEFMPYYDIPHLLFPVVTETNHARKILLWLVQTMESRYALLAEKGLRNIHEYYAQSFTDMPFIVVIIDEIADLLMTGGKDIEEMIIRLAQMARAAGIHLIIATQRPSVDVITGIMKVNFPARLACKVASKIDSRTILDCTGAEKLLGKGDMLFLDHHGIIHRVHGALVTHHDIQAVVSFIKSQAVARYEELAAVVEDHAQENDVLFSQIVNFIKQQEEVSISLIQQEFRIGYNRSARIITMLERKGYILPSDGSKRRKVVR